MLHCPEVCARGEGGSAAEGSSAREGPAGLRGNRFTISRSHPSPTGSDFLTISLRKTYKVIKVIAIDFFFVYYEKNKGKKCLYENEKNNYSLAYYNCRLLSCRGDNRPFP